MPRRLLLKLLATTPADLTPHREPAFFVAQLRQCGAFTAGQLQRATTAEERLSVAAALCWHARIVFEQIGGADLAQKEFLLFAQRERT